MTINFGSGTVQHDTGTDTVNSLTTTNKLSLSGCTLAINGPSAINNDFTLSGGTQPDAIGNSTEKMSPQLLLAGLTAR